MARSIFDPGNPHVERSSSAFTGPDPQNLSRMPEDAVDGEVPPDEAGPEDVVGFDGTGQPVEPPLAAEAQVQHDDVLPGTQADDGGVDAAGHEPFGNPEEPARRWPGE